jgi:predicted glycogen debranching enzyme
MSYIKLDKNKLVNLEYVLTKELLRANRSGAYSCTTLSFCNTRKYHGLLVAPQPKIDNSLHVLLSSVDETIIQHNSEFNLGLHKYPNTYSPKGHKYIIDFETDPIPTHIYQVGGVKLKKEIIFSSFEERIFIKYTLLEATSPTILRLKPFLAFRNYHTLSKENFYANTNFTEVPHGISMCLYENYTDLYMQLSVKSDYIHAPTWYHQIEYIKELDRGYQAHEDLLVPGYFELPIYKNKPVIISFATSEIDVDKIKSSFVKETQKRIPRSSFENCLINSAQQFIIKTDNNTFIKAGYPWHSVKIRDTFIALPGVTLYNKNTKLFREILCSIMKHQQGPHFGIETRYGIEFDYAADTSLWFIWTLQQLMNFSDQTYIDIWREYQDNIKAILYGYKENISPTVRMSENGLLHCFAPEQALTWMNSNVQGKPVIQRPGYTVETNALWYNAIMFGLECAKHSSDKKFINDWEDISLSIPANFKSVFWSKEKGYLCDFVYDGVQDWSIRPNMLIAASLTYSPISEKIRQLVVELVKSKLLIRYGIRTLSPDDKQYKSIYFGNDSERETALHHGTATPWLLGQYTDAYLQLYDKSGFFHIEELYQGLEDIIIEHCIGSISEVYDGDPPHKAGSAISQAWCVSEVLRMKRIIETYKSRSKQK